MTESSNHSLRQIVQTVFVSTVTALGVGAFVADVIGASGVDRFLVTLTRPRYPRSSAMAKEAS